MKGQKVLVPDGYDPNGASRPWKKVTVKEVKGKFFEYVEDDTGKKGICPVSSCKRV